MASKGYVNGFLNRVPSDFKTALVQAFGHVMDTFQLGSGTKALNFSWYAFSSTTHATANTEFSIEHGMETIPTKLIPVVDLTSTGSQLVTFTVSRAPDSRRVYLKSGSTGVVFGGYFE